MSNITTTHDCKKNALISLLATVSYPYDYQVTTIETI